MCTQSVQLKVGLINKSPMGVHALYIYSTNVHLNLLKLKKCMHFTQTQNPNKTQVLFEDGKCFYSERGPPLETY